MAKQMFVSIKFKMAGKILFALGNILILINALDYVFQWNVVNNSLFLLGLLIVVVSLYIIKVSEK